MSGGFTVNYHESDKDISVKDEGAVLLWFFLQLLERLQFLGTAPAIDIAAYAKWSN
jgi:hypothetical protein